MGIIPVLKLNEKRDVEYEINNSESGHGILHRGVYYTLFYEPTRNPQDLKCIGVKLTMRPNPNAMSINHNFHGKPEIILFKSGLFFNREAYHIRLENAIKKCKTQIKDIDNKIDSDKNKIEKAICDANFNELKFEKDREKAVQVHINKIKKCQLRIDETMKKIVPDAIPAQSKVCFKNSEVYEGNQNT